jgi:hypothetical protein
VPIDSQLLERLNRDELIAKATELGARRPELLTRPELRDEIIRLSTGDDHERRRARGWFGVARDLVASVVGQGLNLPDTADLIRGVNVSAPRPAPPVATVTLAEIYAAQGHTKKAFDLLDQVLAKEPDHEAARQVRERMAAALVQEVGSSESPAEDGEVGSDAPEMDVSDPNFDEPLEPSTLTPAAQDAVFDRPQENPTSSVGAFETMRPEVANRPPVIPVEPIEDRVLLVRATSQGLLCHWQVTAKTISRVSLERPNGRLVVRVVEVQTAWDGPVTTEGDIELPSPTGNRTLELRGADTEVRAALGWLSDEHFTVLALAVEFGWDDESGASLRWVPPATMIPELWESVAAAAVADLMQGGGM